MKLTEKQET